MCPSVRVRPAGPNPLLTNYTSGDACHPELGCLRVDGTVRARAHSSCQDAMQSTQRELKSQLVFGCSVCHNPSTINATSDAVVAWRDFLQLLLGIGNDVWAEPALCSSFMLSASFFAPYTHGPHHQCTARWTPMLASLPYTLYRSNADGECAPQ